MTWALRAAGTVFPAGGSCPAAVMKPVRLAGGEPGKQRLCAIRAFHEAASSSAGNRVPAGKRNTCWPGKCSSNTQPHETRWPALQKAGIEALFSAAVLSYPLGVRRPSPAFYRIVLAAADCPAGQVLFVGDHLENDAAAPSLARDARRAGPRPGRRLSEVLPDGRCSSPTSASCRRSSRLHDRRPPGRPRQPKVPPAWTGLIGKDKQWGSCS